MIISALHVIVATGSSCGLHISLFIAKPCPKLSVGMMRFMYILVEVKELFCLSEVYLAVYV